MGARSAARRVVEEASSLLEGLLTTVTVGVVISDVRMPDAPIVYVNPHFEALTGYSAEESVGRNCRFLQGPDTDRDAVARLRCALEESSPAAATLLSRLEAESALARAAALHTSVFNVMAEGILVLGPNATVADVNPAALTLLGLAREQLCGPDRRARLALRTTDGEPLTLGRAGRRPEAAPQGRLECERICVGGH